MYLINSTPKRTCITRFFICCCLVFFSFTAHSACGPIPATSPLFSGDKIKLDKDISINGHNVDEDEYQPRAAINANGTVSTNVNLNLPSLDPASFPINSSNLDQEITSSSTLNHSSEIYYDKLEIKNNNIAINFTGGGPFHIEELEVKEKDVTLNFDAGIYYINKFKIDNKNVTLNVTSPSVIFHIGDEFKIDDKDAKINPSGKVDDFIVYLHANAKFESENKNLSFTGLIYGPNVDEVKIGGKDSSIHGAIIVSGGELKFNDKDIAITYSPSDQTAIGNISTCGNGGGGNDTAAINFNCVETNADGISGKLYTKTTAQSFKFDIVALRDTSIKETNFASGSDHTINVELVDSNSGASCTAYSALSSFPSHNITFTSSDAGTRSSLTMTPSSTKAYGSVKCRITDTTNSPSIVGCSTDSFSIRPTSINISSNLTNSGSTGTPTAKAGENFTITATTVTGYNGIPAINNTKLQAHTGAIQTGSVSGTFSAADSSTGIATGSTFSYSEVGSFQFSAEGVFDDSFTAVDQTGDCTDDFSNTVVAGKVGCKFGNTSATAYIGRFIPDHFDVDLNTPSFASSCGTFTYIGQPVKYTTLPIATITAKNASGHTTQNYTGSFWKIDPSDVTYGFTPSYNISSHSLSIIDSTVPSVSDNGNGTGTLTFADTSSNILAVTKSAVASPFDAEIALSFTLSDTDAIAVANINGSAQTNPVSFGATTPGNGIAFNHKTHRWGRVSLANAHGSEITPLSIPITTEYYDGTNFIKNTADNCSTFTLANDFSISDPADLNCHFTTQTTPVAVGSGSVKASINNVLVSNGSTPLIISDNSNIANGPGTGNTGSVDITTNFSHLPWLLYDWDSDGLHDNCPNARATFGIYENHKNQIYFREIY